MISAAVVGAGRMGRLHARSISNHPALELVAVSDTHPERAAAIALEFGATGSLSDASLVVVATPVHAHVEVALRHLREQWVLVEKPLADSVQEAQRLCHERCLASLTERYHPALRNRPQPQSLVKTSRTAVPSRRGLDTDVVFDLLLHDLDLLHSWVGPLTVCEATGSRGPSGRLDTVSAHLSWSGGEAEVLASRVAQRSRRTVEIDGERVDLLEPHPGKDALHAQLDAVVCHMKGNGRAVTAEQALVSLALAARVRDAV